jgi:hypothetical protein
LDFMNEIVADHPGREIHVALELKYAQAQGRPSAPAAPPSAFPFHANVLILAPSRGVLVAHSGPPAPGAGFTSAQELRRSTTWWLSTIRRPYPFEWKKAVVFSSGPKR